MIPNFVRSLFTLKYDYDSIIEQQRARRLLYITAVIFIATILWFIFITIPSIISDQYIPPDVVIPIVAFILSFVLYHLIQRGYIVWSSRIFVAFMFLAVTPPEASAVNSLWIGTAVLPLVMAGVLLNRRELMVITCLIILNILRAVILGVVSIEEVVSVMVAIFLSGIFLGLFHSSLEHITHLASKLITQTQHFSEYQRDENIQTNQQQIITRAINLLRSHLAV